MAAQSIVGSNSNSSFLHATATWKRKKVLTCDLKQMKGFISSLLWFLKSMCTLLKKENYLTAKASSALWLSLVSSGLSTGVCLVNLVSNWLTSSSECYRERQTGKAMLDREGKDRVKTHYMNLTTIWEHDGHKMTTDDSPTVACMVAPLSYLAGHPS